MAYGEATLRLPTGRYAVWAAILTGPTAFEEPSMMLAALPEIHLTRDSTVTFDARAGKQVTATVDRPGAVSDGAESVGMWHQVAGEQRGFIASTLSSAKIFVVQTSRQVAGFGYFSALTMMEPEIQLTVAGAYGIPVSYADVTFTRATGPLHRSGCHTSKCMCFLVAIGYQASPKIGHTVLALTTPRVLERITRFRRPERCRLRRLAAHQLVVHLACPMSGMAPGRCRGHPAAVNCGSRRGAHGAL